jgi:hypothetical protein
MLEEQLEKIICCCQPTNVQQSVRIRSMSTFRRQSPCGVGILVAQNDEGAWIVSSMVPEGRSNHFVVLQWYNHHVPLINAYVWQGLHTKVK